MPSFIVYCPRGKAELVLVNRHPRRETRCMSDKTDYAPEVPQRLRRCFRHFGGGEGDNTDGNVNNCCSPHHKTTVLDLGPQPHLFVISPARRGRPRLLYIPVITSGGPLHTTFRAR